MPFFSASADVSAILMGGGLEYAMNLVRMGLDSHRINQLLKQRYTVIGGQPFASQVYQAIHSRAVAAIESGARLQRKRSNVPLTYDQHTGSVGLVNNYQYIVHVGIRDTDTGRVRHLPFSVGSDQALGRFDVLNAARVQALHFIGQGRDTLGAASHGEQELTNQLRISAALVSI